MEFSKVNQLDGLFLDMFYQETICDQLLKPFPFDGFKKFLAKVLTKTCNLHTSLWRSQESQGNSIYNLRYLKPSLPYLCFHYISEILSTFLETHKDLFPSLSRLWNLLTLINWLLFITTSRYRTLPERLGRILLPSKEKGKKMNIDYSYTQRVFFFQIVTDTIRSVLPFLKVERFLKLLTSEISSTQLQGDGCVVCDEEDLVTPCSFEECGHKACYYCFMTKKCPRCIG